MCIALTTVATAFAQPGSAGDLRLAEALARARIANPSLRLAAAEVEAAGGRLTQAGLVPANPVLSGEMARHSAPGESQIDRGVALAQEIEIGGQRGLRVAGARHDVAHAELALADRRRLVEAEVRRLFFALAASERRRTLAERSAALAARLASTARRRQSAGDIGALDVRLAEIEEVRTTQALAAGTNERAAAAARLAAALDVPAEEEVAAIADDAEPAALPAEPALVAHALATRPDLAAAREERARLESEAGLARRRGRVPNPVVRGFYRVELLDEHVAGGEVSVPLPIWNREQGTEIALRAQASAAAAEGERLAREIPRQVHLALVRRGIAADAWLRSRRDALPAATEARALLERATEAGYIGLPERLVQQDRLVQAEAASIDAWQALHVADADLIEAVGGTLP